MDDCRTHGCHRSFDIRAWPGRAFTLVEVLVVVAVIAIMVAILLPALSSAREASRTAVCLSNLREMHLICRQYADESKGFGPAIGQPYLSPPNWAFVVQLATGLEGATGNDLYSSRSVLVCPAVAAAYPEVMVRTYAMNATGHAGQPATAQSRADPDNYDDPNQETHIRFDQVLFPERAPLLVDSRRGEVAPPAPPATRTLSPIDFRQAEHLAQRLGLLHASGSFNAGMLDGSARPHKRAEPEWTEPLP